MRRGLLTLGCLVLVLASSRATAQGTAEDKKNLDEVVAAWEAAFNKHDAKAVAMLYAEDCNVAFESGDMTKGRAALEKILAGYFSKNPNLKSKLSDISRTFLTADVVVEDGTWEESGHSEVGLPTKGFYSTILVKRNGKWLAVHDRVWVPVKLPASSP